MTTRTPERIPITVLCGFLGSGKTTILRRWRDDEALRDAAYIIHDLSEFGLDVELLSDEDSHPQQGQLVDRVAALHGEHAREQLHAMDEVRWRVGRTPKSEGNFLGLSRHFSSGGFAAATM